MGTNYYLKTAEKPPCECCGRDFENGAKHIGKSSAGWCFSLHVIPEEGINDLADWERLWNAAGAFIEDEYGDRHTPESMLSWIKDRGSKRPLTDQTAFQQGYRNLMDLLARNHATMGPANLLRHQLGQRCVKHGDGTWDCITGEFS